MSTFQTSNVVYDSDSSVICTIAWAVCEKCTALTMLPTKENITLNRYHVSSYELHVCLEFHCLRVFLGVLAGTCGNLGCPANSEKVGSDHLEYNLLIQHIRCQTYDYIQKKWQSAHCQVCVVQK